MDRSRRFHDRVNRTPGPKRSRPADISDIDVNCPKCNFVTNNSDEFRRHMRDEHIAVNASTSPPKKKEQTK